MLSFVGPTIAAEEFPAVYWIFVGPEARADTPVDFTDRAVDRRSRAGLALDATDYPISTEALAQIEATGVTVRHASRWLRAVSVYGDAESISRLKALPFVSDVRVIQQLAATPPQLRDEPPKMAQPLSAAEEDYGASWLQNQMTRSTKLHDAGLTGAGVLIAMLDTGFDIDHPALAGARSRLVATWDFIHGDSVVNEIDCPELSGSNHQNGHGTLTWGIIGGYVDDTLIGVAHGADFALAKTEITCGRTEIRLEEDNWIAAAEWADSLGADIITSSLGYYFWDDADDYVFDDLNGDSALITRAADMAAAKNILVVTSAGNDRRSAVWPHISLPADGDSVVAVGAVSADSVIMGFSSPGPSADGRIKPDVVALGHRVFSARAEPARGFGYADGTSLSAPLVAGGAALMMEQSPDLTAAEVFHRIRVTADRADNPDNDYGYGLFDAYVAADFIRFEPLSEIQLRTGQPPETTLVTTLGGGAVVPVIYSPDLPEWVEVVDQLDGTALLVARPGADNPLHTNLLLIADLGFVADTMEVSFLSVGSSPDAIRAGPNPFRDSVSIFIAPAAGLLASVSVYDISGEKLWEYINNSPLPADETTEWKVVTWPGRNQHQREVADGVYLVVVVAARQQTTLKLLKVN
jgi:subtilisin family serine protease